MDNEYFASINEVSKQLSVPAYTLRYWEKQFPVVIRPTTGAGGRRYYRADTVQRLVVIRDLLYKHGMTIAGVKKLLRDGKLPASANDFVGVMNDGGANNADPATSAPAAPSLSPDAVQLDAALELLARARDLLQTT